MKECSRKIPGVLLALSSLLASSLLQAEPVALADLKADYQRPDSIPHPRSNPYDARKVELGKMLFFDPRLSGANRVSCATCHNPSFAWGDGLALGIGAKGNVLGRRTPTILNLAWIEPLMWDGRFETLEEQAMGPMSSPDEMDQDVNTLVAELEKTDYVTLFREVFPEEGLTLNTIGKAIATFERTVVSAEAPFDRWINGDEAAISEAAKRGFEVFNGKANCAACHSGWSFTDGSFHDIGLASTDIGRGAIFAGILSMQHAFKTPTLRNVVERAPYMHDGSLTTLREVIDHYDSGFAQRDSLSGDIKALHLSETEKQDLEAFMLTLSSDDPGVMVSQLP